ncbi:hypothetical protein [Mucilaginibacter sp. SG564]|nr:hypothetical protein [Mucilaginibacter sp. SG564]NOW94497.1 hypothetical protein [Mucilaginibacter sp. SG564]
MKHKGVILCAMPSLKPTGALPLARAIRSYCTGIRHWPVSTAIANAV